MSESEAEKRARIRAIGQHEFTRQEMIRTGFWKVEDGDGKVADDWLEKRSALTKEIRALAREQSRFKNRKAMLKAARKKRMADSRAKREETKQRNEQKRAERAAAWQERQSKDIVFLGHGVSAGLHGEQEADPAKLAAMRLPPLKSIEQLANTLGSTVGELRFLAYHREVSKISHYQRFLLPKKTGGHRLISAPMPRLKEVQHAILGGLLHLVPIHDAAHGFVPGRSILSNAEAHVGREIVVNTDLENFFPTITYPRVKGLFRALGFPERIATVLGLLCTEPDEVEVEIAGARWFVSQGPRRLPQGAPTSPALTNILCYRLDKRLAGMATSLGYGYTRYADDMTFSAPAGDAPGAVRKLLWRVQSIVGDEGFSLHPDKTRIMRRGRRQEVTGLVVNEKVAVPRRDLRRFRALVQQVEQSGTAGKSWRGSSGNLLSAMRGYANFITMVDPAKGMLLAERVDALLRKEGWKHVIRHKPGGSKDSEKSRGSKGGILERLKFWKKR